MLAIERSGVLRLGGRRQLRRDRLAGQRGARAQTAGLADPPFGLGGADPHHITDHPVALRSEGLLAAPVHRGGGVAGTAGDPPAGGFQAAKCLQEFGDRDGVPVQRTDAGTAASSPASTSAIEPMF